MEQAESTVRSQKKQAGFTLTELLLASSAFVVIMTSSVAMLVNWNRVNSQAEADLNASYVGTKVLSQIADDVRASAYLFHYATISIDDQQTNPIATYSVAGNSNAFQNIDSVKTNGKYTKINLKFPPVTQGTTLDGVANYADFFGPTKHNADTSLLGVTSQGGIPMLAMISDQPSGIQHPRYIVYWVGTSSVAIPQRTGFVGGPYYACPLFRLEASPSSSTNDDTPTAWYTSRDFIASSSATSSLVFTLGNATASLHYMARGTTVSKATDMKYGLGKVADIVVGPDFSYPFTLRNPHPYSNLSLISPYFATMSIRLSRAWGGMRGVQDVFQMDTSAYARNVPLPTLAAN